MKLWSNKSLNSTEPKRLVTVIGQLKVTCSDSWLHDWLLDTLSTLSQIYTLCKTSLATFWQHRLCLSWVVSIIYIFDKLIWKEFTISFYNSSGYYRCYIKKQWSCNPSRTAQLVAHKLGTTNWYIHEFETCRLCFCCTVLKQYAFKFLIITQIRICDKLHHNLLLRF